jgi:uncharacterized protein (TIGR03382 family)
LQGTVSLSADKGPYAFTLAATAAGRELAFGSFSTQVVDKLDSGGHCGCGAGGGAPLAAVLLASLLRRRRRAC